MATHQFALLAVGVTRQDEGVDAERFVLAELRDHLVGVADDGGAAAAPGSADARPQVGLDVAVGVGSVTEVGLAGDPDR